MTEKIKTITPITCPHCQKDVFVASEFTPPTDVSVFTPSQAEDLKQSTIRAVNDLPISDEAKKPTIDWLLDEDTLIAPGDMAKILDELLNTYDITQEPDVA